MMTGQSMWHSLGRVDELSARQLRLVDVAGTKIALSYRDGTFGAISGVCLHVGGPLGEGTIQNDYVVCPWHQWMFHRISGEARPGIPAAVPLRIETGSRGVVRQSRT